MPEILRDIVCCVGISFLLYRIYNMMISTVKIFIDRDVPESENIIHEQG
jgi:hypothetical protein